MTGTGVRAFAAAEAVAARGPATTATVSGATSDSASRRGRLIGARTGISSADICDRNRKCPYSSVRLFGVIPARPFGREVVDRSPRPTQPTTDAGEGHDTPSR